MQTKSKKLLSLLLTLCMVLGLVPMTAMTVFAANGKADSVFLYVRSGVAATLNADKPFLVNEEAQATADSYGKYTAYLNTVTGELTLDNFQGIQIRNYSNGRKDLTVILKGKNTLNNTVNSSNSSLGSWASDGDIIITTDGVNPGSLTITNHTTNLAETNNVAGISTYRLGGPNDPGAVIIKGEAKITIDVATNFLNSNNDKVIGIFAKQGVSILDNASLDIKARYTGTQYTNECMSYGIRTQNVGFKMNTTGEVSVDASGAGAGSYSVGLGTTNGVFNIDRAGMLKLKWTYYSIYGGPANRIDIFTGSIDTTKFLVIDEDSTKQTMTYIWKAGPKIDVSFTATQVGGESGTADSKAIELKFNQPIAGLTADKVSVEDDSARVTKGELTGSGDTWVIRLAKVHDPGKVLVSVADFEVFHVTSNPRYVEVYKNLIPPIAEVEIEVAPPVVGGTPAAPVSNTENTTIHSSSKWNMGADTTFQVGKTYRLEVVIHPTAGYSFSNTATAKINGNAATIPWQGTGFINCYYDFTVDADPAHSDATLAGIVAKYYDGTHKSASFTEAFNPETYSYTVNLPEAAQYFTFGLYTKAGQTVTATVDTEFLYISTASELYDYDFETNSVDTDDATKTVVLTVTAKDGETTKDYTITVNQGVTPPATYTVTIQNDGNGTGSASPTTAEAGTEITLSASPDSGYVFKEWEVISGGVMVTDNKFTMPANDVTVKAHFEATSEPTYSVTLQNDDNGTGSASPATAEAGTEITLSATPNSGYVFKEWEVVSGGVTITGNKFTMPANDVTIKAHFEATSEPTYSVTVQDDGNGTGSASPTSAEAGTEITLSASPDSGYVFKDWEVISGGVTVSENKFTMPATDVTVKAHFEATSEPTYSVTVQDDGNGTGSASPSTAEAGTEITLSASPDSGFVSKEWEVISGGVTIAGNKFTMPANDVTVKAHFEATTEPTYSVTIIGGGSGADGARDYEAGDPVTIKAGNNSGYTFTGWTSPDVTITNASDKTASFTMPAKNVTVTANWRYNGGGGGGGSSYTDYTITASADKGGSISPSGSVTVREKSDKTFTITADKGYVISDVLVDGKSVGALKTYTFTNVTKAHTIKAKFVEEDKNNPNTGAYIPFDDVKINDWFINSVMWAYENGLMVGTSTTTFSPNMETTRGMIVTILYRLEGSPKAGTSGFDDVSDGKYYANAVAWAADNKIVSGYGNGKFGPDDSLTREQLVTILYNYSKFKGYDITAGQDLGSFNDETSVSGYAKTAMQWAVKHGIVTGIGADLLSPATTATRAQMAAILERYSENIVE